MATKKFLETLRKCDLFSSSQMLRYNDEPQYTTLTGAVCSVMLVIAFTTIFYSVTIRTINREIINWSSSTIQQPDPLLVRTSTDKSSNFMFAMGVNGIDFSASTRYFDIVMLAHEYHTRVSYKVVQIPLQSCTKSQWVNLPQVIASEYDRLSFNQFLCPPENQIFELQGKYTSSLFKFVQINIRKCNDSTDPSRPCVGDAAVAAFLAQQENFFMNFYIVNPLINPSSPDYLSYYLEDRNYVTFTTTSGMMSNFYFEEFQITTDRSLLPWSDQLKESGIVVNGLSQNIPYDVSQDIYCKVYLRKAGAQTSYQRSFQKADETLSYIGGLFSCLMIFYFLLNWYTEYSYEIDMADRLYQAAKEEPLRSGRFNILSFFAYMFYKIVTAFGGCWNWKFMKTIDDARQEIGQQLDVTFLMRRLIFLERAIHLLLNDTEITALHLHDKLTVSEAKSMRQHYHLGKRIKKALNTDSIRAVHPEQSSDNLPSQVQRTEQLEQSLSKMKKLVDSKSKRGKKAIRGLDMEVLKKLPLAPLEESKLKKIFSVHGVPMQETLKTEGQPLQEDNLEGRINRDFQEPDLDQN